MDGVVRRRAREPGCRRRRQIAPARGWRDRERSNRYNGLAHIPEYFHRAAVHKEMQRHAPAPARQAESHGGRKLRMEIHLPGAVFDPGTAWPGGRVIRNHCFLRTAPTRTRKPNDSGQAALDLRPISQASPDNRRQQVGFRGDRNVLPELTPARAASPVPATGSASAESLPAWRAVATSRGRVIAPFQPSVGTSQA